MCFIRPMEGTRSGDNIKRATIGPDRTESDTGDVYLEKGGGVYGRADHGYRPHDTYFWNQFSGQAEADKWRATDPKMLFTGRFGADRNANQVLDRGPLPTSTRLRAIEVARYLVYDPRLTVTTR
jgi:hypothetical protein